MRKTSHINDITRKKMLVAMIMLVAIFMVMGLASAESYEQGQAVDVKVSCSLIDCGVTQNISIVAPDSTTLVNNKQMSHTNSYMNYSFNLTTQTGQYNVYLNNYSTSFEVSPNGEQATSGKAIFYIGLLFVVIVFLVLCVLSFAHFDNLLNRVGMLGLGYLILVAISFIAWNMSQDFLTSSPFIISMFQIIFYVLMFSALPLILGSFAWYFIMLFQIKEIQKMMDKGMPEEEAERRVKGRKHK